MTRSSCNPSDLDILYSYFIYDNIIYFIEFRDIEYFVTKYLLLARNRLACRNIEGLYIPRKSYKMYSRWSFLALEEVVCRGAVL